MPFSFFDKEHPIFRAAYKGELERLKAMLKKNPSLRKKRAVNKASLLLFAAEGGRLEVVKWLLSKEGGASIHEKNKRGETALMYAASRGKIPLVQWLLSEEGGASIHEKSNNDDTALLTATYHGHLPLIQWLLQEGGASLEEKDKDGTTALLIAALRGHLPVVQWLIQEGGASIHENGINGNTALLLAAYHGHRPLAQWLLQEGGASIYEKNINGNTALLFAAWRNHLDTLHCLLDSSCVSYAFLRQQYKIIVSLFQHKQKAFSPALEDAFKDKINAYDALIKKADSDIDGLYETKDNTLIVANEFFCPISQELLQDPVLACDGHVYEQTHIKRWLVDNNTSPITGAALKTKDLTPVFAIKKQLDKIYKAVDALYLKISEPEESAQVPVQTLPRLLPMWGVVGVQAGPASARSDHAALLEASPCRQQ